MICPKCGTASTSCIQTRQYPTYRHRRYKCLYCNVKFSTREEIIEGSLTEKGEKNDEAKI